MKLAVLLLIAIGAVLVAFVVPPIAQDPAYHLFADQREMLGIPNFWDVISNVPFLFIGIVAVFLLLKRQPAGCLPELRSAYLIFFAGVLLVAFGSGYYHWAPTNESLVWDRLPMTLGFMAFTAAIVGENISLASAKKLLWPLLIAGVLSVFYWQETEQAGAGDLRPYGLVQFLPMLLLPLILLMFPSRFDSNKWIWLAMVAYGLAKVLEFADVPIYEFLGLSGHTLKHLAAAVGAWCILEALRRRNFGV